MQRIVLRFGLIAGAVMSAMMFVTMVLLDHTIDLTIGMVIGYTTMVVAFLMVYFGIRTYRDEVLGGMIGFGRAFQVGILITVIACVCYVATWEVIYYRIMPDFGEKYANQVMAKARADGATQQQLDAKAVEMKEFNVMYKNPVYNVAFTFIEPFPVGLVIALACAGVLSRRRRVEGGLEAGLSA